MTKRDFSNYKAVTHSGKPHVDDLLCEHLLRILGMHVIRVSREEYSTIYEPMAVRHREDPFMTSEGEKRLVFFDIGGGRFDGKPQTQIRLNGVPYSSFGLIFKDYGQYLLEHHVDPTDPLFDETLERIDDLFVSAIDAHMAGISQMPNNAYRWTPYALATIQNTNYNMYGEAFVQTLLHAVIEEIYQMTCDDTRVREAIKEVEDHLLVLDLGCSFVREAQAHNFNANHKDKIWLVVHPNTEGWTLRCMPSILDPGDVVIRLPGTWLRQPPVGCRNDGRTFVHKRLMMATFDTKEQAIDAARLAMRERVATCV